MSDSADRSRHYNDTRSSYIELRVASDLICCERCLSTIEKPGSTHTPRQLYLAEKNSEPTRYNIMRQDIDIAIVCSYDSREFLHTLRPLGYIVRDDPGTQVRHNSNVRHFSPHPL